MRKELSVLVMAVVSLNSQQPTFEAASVKPNKSIDARDADMKVLAGGRVVIRNVPLLMIAAAAWNVPF